MIRSLAHPLRPAIAAPLLLAGSAALAQSEPRPTAQALVEQARQLGRSGQCRPGDVAANGDILVCGRAEPQGLPLPEIAGPRLAQTDGAAVDPSGVPCADSGGVRDCFAGINIPQIAIGAVNVVRSLIDPDRNLGEGGRIPRRIRGSNR